MSDKPAKTLSGLAIEIAVIYDENGWQIETFSKIKTKFLAHLIAELENVIKTNKKETMMVYN